MKRLFGLMLVAVLLFLAGSVTGVIGQTVPEVKKITHFLAFDLDKQDFAPYDSTEEKQIYVVTPEGIQPGVVVGESDDSKGVLVVWPELATKILHKGAPDDPLATPAEPTEPLKQTEK